MIYSEKIIRSKTISEIIVLMLALLVASCDDLENNWERPNDLVSFIPSDCVQLIGSFGVSGNIVYFDYTPKFYADFDFWNLKTTSIDYYIDDDLIITETKAPYSFKYNTVLPKGKHQLKLNVKITDLVNHKEIVIQPTKEFEITTNDSSSSDGDSDDPFEDGLLMSAHYSYSDNSAYVDINSLELMSILTNSGWSIKEVSYYLDNQLIETVTEKPYDFNYHAVDLKLGTHLLAAKAKITNSINGNELYLINTFEIKIKRGYHFYLDVDQYKRKGEPLTARLFLLEKRSDTGCQIQSVTYYVDDKKVETIKESPYLLSYDLADDNQPHTLKALISYKDESSSNSLSTSTTINTNINYITSNTLAMVEGVKGNHSYYVGDQMEYFSKLFLGDYYDGKEYMTYRVKFFLDDNLIGESSVFPYLGTYSFSSADIGKHLLRIESEIYENDRLIDKWVSNLNITVSD